MKLKSIIAAVLIPVMLTQCSTLGTGDATLLVTPAAFVAASRSIDNSDDKSRAISKVRQTATNLRVASTVIASGEITRDQFVSLIAQSGADPEMAYLASYLFDIYITKIENIDTGKFTVAVKLLNDLARGLEDAANLASMRK